MGGIKKINLERDSRTLWGPTWRTAMPLHLEFVEASARESSEKETMCRVRCLIRLHFLVKCRVVLRCNSADEQKRGALKLERHVQEFGSN